MNYLIQRGKVRGQFINVPDGLPELLLDISREVMRCQPTTECLCEFIIDYLHSELEAREKERLRKTIIETTLQSLEQIVFDLSAGIVNRRCCLNVGNIIESSFSSFVEKARCEKQQHKQIVKFQELDILAELKRRCKFSMEELNKNRPLIEEAYNRFCNAYMAVIEVEGGLEAMHEYFQEREKLRIEELRLSSAATKIQSFVRGCLTRIKFQLLRSTLGKDFAGGQEDRSYTKETSSIHSGLPPEQWTARDRETWSQRSNVSQDLSTKRSLATVAGDVDSRVLKVPSQADVRSTTRSVQSTARSVQSTGRSVRSTALSVRSSAPSDRSEPFPPAEPRPTNLSSLHSVVGQSESAFTEKPDALDEPEATVEPEAAVEPDSPDQAIAPEEVDAPVQPDAPGGTDAPEELAAPAEE